VFALPDDIATYLRAVASAHPDIRAIWLVGSRVNPKNRPPQDWDFLAFGSAEVLAALKADNVLRRVDVDLLIVTDGDSFESPWPRSDLPGVFKSGNLKNYEEDGLVVISWEWKEVSATEAKYTGEGLRRMRAVRVYPET
jgi:hypothetical protein